MIRSLVSVTLVCLGVRADFEYSAHVAPVSPTMAIVDLRHTNRTIDLKLALAAGAKRAGCFTGVTHHQDVDCRFG